MATGQDPTREFSNKFNEDSSKKESQDSSKKESQDKTKADLNKEAREKPRRGIDNLPQNLDGNRFPISIKSPSVEGLGDWKQQYKELNYPGIEAMSGYTKASVFPEDISKVKFNTTNLKLDNQPVSERIKTRKQYYNLFDDFADKQFIHLLDYFSAQKGLGDEKPIPTGNYADGKTSDLNTKDIYIGSFIKTLDDNEDPTMLGYDLKIRYLDSPLFNGTAQSFIDQFGRLGNTEIASRSEILTKFTEQFNKFFKNDLKNDSTTQFDGTNGAKTYYLKKLTGLNKLNDASDSAESKQFVDYGKDFITLTFYEDVTQNIGYLASLYKALSYSRLNGKQILPENVLRFDIDIEITEIRKYKRVFKNLSENKLEFVADKISKYTYTLYECQFYFPTLPHADTIDMWSINLLEDYEIKFNYKWSTMKFSKFTFGDNVAQNGQTYSLPTINEYIIDNSQKITTEFKTNTTNNSAIVDNSIQSAPPTKEPKKAGGVDYKTGDKEEIGDEKVGSLEETKQNDKTKGTEKASPDSNQTDTTNSTIDPKKGSNGTTKKQLEDSAKEQASNKDGGGKNPNSSKISKRLDEIKAGNISPTFKRFSQDILGGERIKKDLINAFVNVVNKNIVSQAALLNKTLQNIRDSIPGVSNGMRSPKNIYPTNIPRRLPVGYNLNGPNVQQILEGRESENRFTTPVRNNSRNILSDARREVSNFVGRSIRNFFTKL